jgi:hypothetical protein
MVWCQPTDHTSDCYFFLTNTTGITSKSKQTFKYRNLPSTIRPVPHGQDLPIPPPPSSINISERTNPEPYQEENYDIQDPSFEVFTEPHLFSQGDLNDLVRDLNLSK